MKNKKLIQFRVDYVLSNGINNFKYLTGKNELSAIKNFVVNIADKKEDATIKKITIVRV